MRGAAIRPTAISFDLFRHCEGRSPEAIQKLEALRKFLDRLGGQDRLAMMVDRRVRTCGGWTGRATTGAPMPEEKHRTRASPALMCPAKLATFARGCFAELPHIIRHF